MKICIVSTDKRYIKVNELLLQRGYDSFIYSYEEKCACDCLLLSVKKELSEAQLTQLFDGVNEHTLVLCGNSEQISRFFKGKIIDYGKEEKFLIANAQLTAEATLPYLYELSGESVEGKNIFVVGYGRIGKILCKILKGMGANVSSYARRANVIEQMYKDGITYADLNSSCTSDIVLNTVPYNIFSEEAIRQIPSEAYIVDLASPPYGFSDMSRVHIASGLPGKYLTNSASKAVFDTICDLLPLNGTEDI